MGQDFSARGPAHPTHEFHGPVLDREISTQPIMAHGPARLARTSGHHYDTPTARFMMILEYMALL